jgi:hypothetical protein
MVDEITLPALGLVGHAFLVDFLVFRGQRRLLRRAKSLGRIEFYALAPETRVDRVPLTFPVGVFRVGGLCDACADQRRQRQCPNRASKQHDDPPVVSHSLAGYTDNGAQGTCAITLRASARPNSPTFRWSMPFVNIAFAPDKCAVRDRSPGLPRDGRDLSPAMTTI